MAPRFCDHTFHSCGEVDPTLQLTSVRGMVIVCVYCGQVRHLYQDGTVVIYKDEGEIRRNSGTTDEAK